MKKVKEVFIVNEYEYLLSTAVYGKLKEKVKGKVTVYVNDNRLVVKVENFGVGCETGIDNIDHKIMQGLTSDTITNDFMEIYKKYIAKKFFR